MLSAVVAYEPAIVGAPAAWCSTLAIHVLPTAHDSTPSTNSKGSRTIGSRPSTSRPNHPASTSTPPIATTGRAAEPDRRPPMLTPANEPAPNNTSTTGTHHSPS